MTSELTNTTESALIPEEWGPRYIAALYDPKLVAPRCLNVLGDFHGVGDIAHIAVQSTAYSPQAIGLDGSVSPNADALTDATVTIDKKTAVLIEPLKTTRVESFANRFSNFPENAGQAIAQDIEAEILGLYSGVTQSQGSGAGDIGEDEILAAITQLGKNKLPVLSSPGDFCLALHYQQLKSIKKSGALDFRRTGVSGQGGAAMADVPAMFGIDVVFTNQVQTSTYHQNLLFHNTAFGWAAQKMAQFEQSTGLANRKITDILAVWSLYGADVVIANRAVKVLSATS